jgi:hypothetical protein
VTTITKCLILFCILIAPYRGVFALQKALVVNENTVVYADETLESPIGFIKRGKIITVGERMRRNSSVATIVVSGKVAFVKVLDLNLDPATFENPENGTIRMTSREMLNEELTPIEDFRKRNSLFFDFHQFNMGNQWDDYSQLAGDEEASSLSIARVMFHHRFFKPQYAVAMGVGYYFVGQENIAMEAMTFEGQAYFSPLYTGLISIDFFVGVGLSALASLEAKGSNDRNNGSLISYQAGGQVTLIPISSISVHAGLAFRRIAVEGMDEIRFANTNLSGKLNVLTGADIFAGVSFLF